MKAFVAGVVRMHGKGKASGQPYRFATLIVLNNIQPVSRENMTVEGFGFQPGEIALTPEALEQFSSIKLPGYVDLKTDMELRAGKMEPIVTGVNP